MAQVNDCTMGKPGEPFRIWGAICRDGYEAYDMLASLVARALQTRGTKEEYYRIEDRFDELFSGLMNTLEAEF